MGISWFRTQLAEELKRKRREGSTDDSMGIDRSPAIERALMFAGAKYERDVDDVTSLAVEDAIHGFGLIPRDGHPAVCSTKGFTS